MYSPLAIDHSTPARRPAARARLNAANVGAGISAAVFYACAATPVHWGAMASLHISAGEATGWYFATFMTSAVVSLLLSLHYRMPIPIGWSSPALIFLAATGGRYTHAELAGASLVAGVVLLLLGATGASERLMRLIPLPIVMGMVAGSLLGFVTGVFREIPAHPMTAVVPIAAYVAARIRPRAWLPPMGAAVLAGVAAAAARGQLDGGALDWHGPTVRLVAPELHAGNVLALALPMVVIALGTGNVPGFAILASHGFRAPVRRLNVLIGLTSIVNALFGGHVASFQSGGTALLAGPDAGPRESRYLAAVVGTALAIPMALGAGVAAALVGLMPAGLVPVIAGLALLTTFGDALRRATSGEAANGAIFAFAIAASGATALGIGAACWALAGGLLVSLATERSAVRAARQAS